MSASEDYLDSLLAGAMKQNEKTGNDGEQSSFSSVPFQAADTVNTQDKSAKHLSEEEADTEAEELMSLLKQTASTAEDKDESVRMEKQPEEQKESTVVSEKQHKEQKESTFIQESEPEGVDDYDEVEEDIEAQIRAAEAEGMNAAAQEGLMGLSLSEEAMDLTEYARKKASQDEEITDVADLLDKSDKGELVDTSSLPQEDDARSQEELLFPMEMDADGKNGDGGDRDRDETKTADNEEDIQEAKPQQKKKSLLSLFSRRRRKDEEEEQEETVNVFNGDDITFGNPLDEAADEEAGNPEGKVPDRVPAERGSWKEDNPEEAGTGKKQNPEKEKKETIFTKLFHFLIEEEEEENTVPEQAETKLSQENLAILSELDASEQETKKKKKEKKKKPKKKPVRKPVKVAKKKNAAPQEQEPPLPARQVKKAFVLAVSLLVILLLLCLFLPEKLVVGEARDSYYQKDYKSTFLSLYGKKLNESDRLIYERSKRIVILERKYEAYENYAGMGMQLEALDALFTGLRRYDEMAEDAVNLNIEEPLKEIHDKIMEALYAVYGVDAQRAAEILTFNELDYNNVLQSILNGTPFEKMEDSLKREYGLEDKAENHLDENGGSVSENDRLPDLLPEELNYQEDSPVDTAVSQENISDNAAVGFTGEAVNQNGQPVTLQIESDTFR